MLGRTLKAKTFWRFAGGQPTNLEKAIDLLPVADIDTLVQLKTRMSAYGLWSYVETIKGLWSTSSLGIEYNGPTMQNAIDGSKNFCKDTMVGESYHGGASCWREVVAANTPGLHFCAPNSIHIDPHQTSVGKGWGIEVGGGKIGTRNDVCSYSLLAFISHMADVEGGRTVNMFERYDKLVERIKVLRPKAEQHDAANLPPGRLAARVNDLDQRAQVIRPVLQAWAAQGFEGGDAGAQVKSTDATMDEIENGCEEIEAAVTPPAEPDGQLWVGF